MNGARPPGDKVKSLRAIAFPSVKRYDCGMTHTGEHPTFAPYVNLHPEWTGTEDILDTGFVDEVF